MPDLTQAIFPPQAFLARLAMPAVQVRLTEAAARAGIAAEAVPALARAHGLRIAARFSPRVARWGERFLDHLWARLFDGIEVQGLAALPALEYRHTLVYLPCHRSHLDYLLMSYVLHRGGLLPPHIAAGDNLDLPVVGPLLRRGGGFFMRRRFKGDPLYVAVFAEYLEALLERGLPIEFFIEGGRSRTGAMLPPKTGLLGMLLAAHLRRPQRPLLLVPVSIGYEKLPEGASYLRELAGHPKQKESLAGVFGAIRLLRQRYGRPCLSAGTPLAVDDWLAMRCGDWRNHPPAVADQRELTQALAEDVTARIAAATRVNPVNLVALALLACPDASASRAALIHRIARLQARAGERATALAPAACLERALALGMVSALGDRVAAPGEQAELLRYFRNNVVHLFAEEA